MNRQSIPLPPATMARLEALVLQRQALDSVIEATVQTAREALDVPAAYELRDVRMGFVAPQEGATNDSDH